MYDIDHIFGNDLQISETGDLAVIDALPLSQQRILRRLLTPVQGYIWHIKYGAGLGAYVGASDAMISEVLAIITLQVSEDDTIAASPPPEIKLRGSGNNLYCSIEYTDAVTNTQEILSFSLEA